MPHPSPVVEALHAASRALSSGGLPWYVFGAQAVAIWGIPRLSADLDITVKVDPAAIGPLVREMTTAGFHLRITDVEEFVARTRVLPFLHVPTGLLVDVVLSGPGIEEQFHRRAVLVDLGGVSAPFISPEDLVVTKLLAGRSKDLDDVRGVLRTRRGQLDLTYLRSTLALLEQALAQSDLVPALEAAIADSTR